MPNAKFLIRVSRSRFWLYILGPYLVGLAAGARTTTDLLRVDTALFAIYFLFPANLLIYGINDIFDYETDRRNPKKKDYETLVSPSVHGALWIMILLLNVPFLVAAVYIAPRALPSLAGFLFFSIFYSAPPIRAKALPVVDSLFNVLYVFPAAFAYQMLTGAFPPLAVLAAGGLWTAAMHAFSAIPDIKADREAGLSTIATLFGRAGTLLFCTAAYGLSAAISVSYLGTAGYAVGLIYVAVMLATLLGRDSGSLFRIYRVFPVLNALVGFALFWIIVAGKFL